MRDFVDDRIKDRWQEFAEVVHFTDPGKAADLPKLDDRWNPGLWLGKSLAPDEHYVGTSAGVRRCRSIWRRPEKQRWDTKMSTEMNGEPWNPTPTAEREASTGARSVHHSGTSTVARKAVRRVRKCIRQNAEHDSRRFWTMKRHRQKLRVQANQMLRPQDRQTVAPRPVQAVAQHRLRVDPRQRMSTWKQQKARQHSR